MFLNKVVVITGGAGGIGKCIAEEFEKQGATVCVIDLQPGNHYVGDISKKEYWAMVKGAYAAFLPILLCILAVGILGFFLIKWWLS